MKDDKLPVFFLLSLTSCNCCKCNVCNYFGLFCPGGGELKFELNTLNVKTKAMMAISLTDFFVVEFLLQRTDQIKRHIALSALL